MKYITFAVPCYNSQDYVHRCVESLLPGGEDVEILLINDGSVDRTAEILDEYERKYPGIVKAVHKENGGHGSGVNKGLELARGLYYKVVDSDDWLEKKAYLNVLNQIKEHVKNGEKNTENQVPDLYVCNYVYNHLDEGIAKSMAYRNVFPEGKMCTWNDIGRFHPSQYLIMHALIFRTAVLRESGVKLPEHCFYVDNIFAYQPLPFVKNIFYMDVDLYQYYLGRDDQSVNEKVLMKRIDQQIRVTKLVAGCVDLDQVRKQYPKLAVYMCRNISIMMAISSIHLLLIGDEEALEKRRELWGDIKRQNHALYYRLSWRTLSGWTNLPGRIGGKLTVSGYRLAKKIYRFQ